MQVNAAVCDEVVRMEERVTQAKEERQYLVKHVLQQQVMSTMLGQMAGKHAATTAMASPGKGGSGGSGGPRMASHSVAQLLGEAEKRSKKKSGSATAAGGGVKRKAGVINSSGVFLFLLVRLFTLFVDYIYSSIFCILFLFSFFILFKTADYNNLFLFISYYR